ncbi:hemagglutinin-neuraminidase protein [Salmon aquaparamyxovirus]|uniref:Hemagglutinin-neuraminidase protein n=1 Tax=Salmon aquaparamyxovirus TaxID=381543 RepID=A0A3G2KTE9_9MONO|nr:hemagglutinin-neuraminidase protein [Salmon aquaparamyxovirus]
MPRNTLPRVQSDIAEFYGSSSPIYDTPPIDPHLDNSKNSGYWINTVLLVGCIVLALCGLGIGIASQSSNDLIAKDMISTKSKLDKLTADTGETLALVRQEISPKVSLLQGAILATLPAQINGDTSMVVDTIKGHCKAPIPVAPQPGLPPVKHGDNISPLNPVHYWKCESGTPKLYRSPNVTFIPGPSPLPTTSTPGGCVRIPTFHVGDKLYSYSSNLISSGCRDIGKSYQNIQVGIIVRSQEGIPELNPLLSHTFPIIENRKSCSVVSADKGAYLFCSQPKVSEPDDYKSPGIEPMSLDYVDLNGTVRSWIYTPAEIITDYPYAALYPGVGSGVVMNGKLLFIVYGGLLNGIQVPAYCVSPECPTPNQAKCDSSQYNGYLGGRQVVSGIATVDLTSPGKPMITVETISPDKNWFGAEGRLIVTGGRVYIYLRSTGWHGLLQTGIITSFGPISINWVTNTAVSRPGNPGCSWENRCPKGCLTGVYSDAYPLSPDYTTVATMILHDSTTRKSPVMVYATPSEMVNYASLNGPGQGAAYSTTTCVTVDDEGYCLTAVELSPGLISSMQPVLVATRIPKSCV